MGGRAMPVTTIESEAQAARPRAARPHRARKQIAADFLVLMFLSLKFSRDEDDSTGLSHCAQLDRRRYALRRPGGLSRVLRPGPSGVKINHADYHARLSDSHLSERSS